MTMAVLKCDNVLHGGAVGAFRGNAESFGWRSAADAAHLVVRPVGAVRRAEWREGDLRILCEVDGAEPEVLGFDRFQPQVFDDLWRYFEQNCGVYVKKHRLVADLCAKDFDAAMRGLEEAADRVDEAAPQSVTKKAREVDLMKRVEGVRNGLDQAIRGDKQALSSVFAENGCERIGRLRLVVDTVQLDVFDKDPRWLHLANVAAAVESVLCELGAFRWWRPPVDGQHESMLRRQVVLELRRRQGHADPDSAGDPVSQQGAEDGEGQGPRVGLMLPIARVQREGLPPPPLQGLLPPGSDLLSKFQARPSDIDAVPHAVAEAHAPARQHDCSAGRSPRGIPPELRAGRATIDPDSVRRREDRLRRRRQGLVGRLEGREHGGGLGAILEGWVWKRSQHLKKWRRRWLVLTPDHFATYRTSTQGGYTERVEKGSVVSIYNADNEVLQARCFCVQAVQKRAFATRMVRLYMVCDDEAQKEDWMTSIGLTLGSTGCRGRHS
mmetsp:Transcript_106371/g.297824  ORF Transcript_106371/g.297824 Transcript_106371/m.297824 type:complete len:495 (+) Transcript_106371:84-1568(+)